MYEISFFEWSYDSSLLLIKEKNSSIIQIRNLDNNNWEGKIIDELYGIKYATWFINSQFLITISDNLIKMNFYSISSKLILSVKDILFNDLFLVAIPGTFYSHTYSILRKFFFNHLLLAIPLFFFKYY